MRPEEGEGPTSKDVGRGGVYLRRGCRGWEEREDGRDGNVSQGK